MPKLSFIRLAISKEKMFTGPKIHFDRIKEHGCSKTQKRSNLKVSPKTEQMCRSPLLLTYTKFHNILHFGLNNGHKQFSNRLPW